MSPCFSPDGVATGGSDHGPAPKCPGQGALCDTPIAESGDGPPRHQPRRHISAISARVRGGEGISESGRQRDGDRPRHRLRRLYARITVPLAKASRRAMRARPRRTRPCLSPPYAWALVRLTSGRSGQAGCSRRIAPPVGACFGRAPSLARIGNDLTVPPGPSHRCHSHVPVIIDRRVQSRRCSARIKLAPPPVAYVHPP